MKKKILLFSITAAMGLGSLALLSNNAGPAQVNGLATGNRTGAYSVTCADAGCHPSGGSSTLGSFKKIIDKSNGWDVTTHGYVEGHTYQVTVEGVHSSLVNFGFQACALFDADQKPAGKPVATAAQTAVKPTKPGPDTVWVIEHTGKLPGVAGLLNVNFDWTAPAVGTNKGAVKFWGCVNAVNGDANTTGDQVSPSFNKVFANVTSVHELGATPQVTVYPNPLVGDANLKIRMENAPSSEYTITAFDLRGRKLFTETYNSNGMPFEYNTSNWAPGMYHLQIINKEGLKHTTPLIKY